MVDQGFLVKVVSLGVTLLCLLLTCLANMKDWFHVPGGLRAPVFGVWHVCFDNGVEECTDTITEGQYGYNSAVYATRIFLLLASILLTMLLILVIASILNSPKVQQTSLVFPILALFAFICMLLACPIMEGGVRLRVTNFLTITAQPRIDSVTGWAGVCGWLSFAFTLVNVGVMGALYALTKEGPDSDI